MRRIASWFALGTLALLLLALAWLWTADLGTFRPQVERFLSDKIGREFRIEGAFSVDLDRRTTIIAERVRVANAAWADSPDMVTIGRVEIRIDTWSLLGGPVVIERLDLDEPVIRLANPGDAEPNWVLPIEAEADSAGGEPRSGPAVLLRQIDIHRARLRLESVHRERALDLEVDRIRQRIRADGVLDVEMRATLNGQGIEVDGGIGTWRQWRAGRDIEFDLAGRLGTLDLIGRGRIDDLANPRRPEIHFTARGPDIDDLTRMLAIGEEGEGDIDLSASLVPVPEGPLALTLEGNLGQTGIDASGGVQDLQSLDGLELRASSSGPDLARILRLAGLPGTVTGPFSATCTIEGREGGGPRLEVDLETSLGTLGARGALGDLPALLGSRIEFRIAGDSLARVGRTYRLPDLPERPFEVAGAIDYTAAGIRTRGPLRARLDGLSAEADGLLALGPGLRGSDLDFAVQGASLATAVEAFAEAAPVPRLPFDARGRLQVERDGLRFRQVTGSLGRSAIRASGLLVPGPGIAGSRFGFEMEGPAFEELVEPVGEVRVRPGAYELSGDIAFHVETIDLGDVRLLRQGDVARLDLELGLPISERRSSFALRANGRDVRRLVQGVEGFQLHEQAISVEARGGFQGRRLALEQLKVRLGKATLDAQGVLDFTATQRSGEFELALDVPDLAALGTLDGRGLRAQALAAEAHAVGSGDALDVDRLEVRIGESVVRGRARLREGGVPRLDLALSADAFELRSLLEEDATTEQAAVPGDGRVIPDLPLPFDAMRRLDGSVGLEIGELRAGRLLLRDVELDVRLEDGALEVPAVGFGSRSGRVRGKGRLDPAGGGSASLQFVARDFSLDLGEANADHAATSNVKVSLQGVGGDLRTLAGNLDGVVFLDIRDARIDNSNNRLIEMLYGNLLEEVLNTVNPFRKRDPYTRVECAVLSARIKKGHWDSAPASFVGTGKIRVVINSSIDLKTEALRVGIRTTPRSALSISAAELVNPYVQVVGSLARPRLAIDKKGVLLTGGVAVGTGGLSLLAQGLYDRLSNAGDPCKRAASAATAALGDGFPELAIEAAEPVE